VRQVWHMCISPLYPCVEVLSDILCYSIMSRILVGLGYRMVVCGYLGVSVSVASLADVYLFPLPMCGRDRRNFLLQYYVMDTCSLSTVLNPFSFACFCMLINPVL
jgi:hypothetical protein